MYIVVGDCGFEACPETQNTMVSSSKEVEVMVCGLDHWFSALQLSVAIYAQVLL